MAPKRRDLTTLWSQLEGEILSGSAKDSNSFLAISEGRKVVKTTPSSGGGTPGGSDTQVQFNSGSTFSGSSNLTYDYSNTNLYLTGNLNVLGDISASSNISASAFYGINLSASNNIYAGNDITAGNDISAKHNLSASNNIYAGQEIHANNSIFSTIGNIYASAGSVVANADVAALTGDVTAFRNVSANTGDIIASNGDVIAGFSSPGDVSASANIYAGYGIEAGHSIEAGLNVEAGMHVVSELDIYTGRDLLVCDGTASLHHVQGCWGESEDISPITVLTDITSSQNIYALNLTIAESASIGTDLSVGNSISASNNVYVGNDILSNNDISASHNLYIGNDITASHDVSASNNIYAANNISASVNLYSKYMYATYEVNSNNVYASSNVEALMDVKAGYDISASHDVTSGRDVTAIRSIVANGDAVIRTDILCEHDISASNDITAGRNLSVCYGTASLHHVSGCSPITVLAPISSSTYISASTYYGSGAGLTGYPHDIRPRSTALKNLFGDVVSFFDSDTSSSFVMEGHLYSPSNIAAVIATSSNYVTASIVSQSYEHNGQFNFTLSASLGGASEATTGSIQIAVQSVNHPDDTPQTITLRFGFNASSIAGCSLWLDGADASTITTYSDATTGATITEANLLTSISGCQLWLDANDSGSITETGNAISQWNDKSGNSNHYAQGASANQPTYVVGGWSGYAGTGITKNAVSFGANKEFDPSHGTYPGLTTSGTSKTIFAVFKSLNSPAALGGNVFHIGTTASTTHCALLAGWSYGENTYVGRAEDYNSYHVFADYSWWPSSDKGATIGKAAPALFTGVWKSTSVSFRADSDEIYSEAGTFSTVNGQFLVGGWFWALGSYYYQGLIAEILYFDVELTVDERMRIENYLRLKWGTTPSPGRVKQWNDKSGLGNHAKSHTPTKAPNIGTGIINSKNTVNFNQDGPSVMYLPDDSVLYPGEEPAHIFTVIKRSSGTQRDWGAWFGSGNNYDVFTGIHDTQYHHIYLGQGGLTPASAVTITNTVDSYILEVKVVGTTVSFFRDGVADGVTSLTAGSGWGSFSNSDRLVGAIKKRRYDDGHYHGHIAEMIIFSASLSTTDQTDVVNYLKEKWDIS
jgi:predicted acyltransferase (DUF342 family)